MTLGARERGQYASAIVGESDWIANPSALGLQPAAPDEPQVEAVSRATALSRRKRPCGTGPSTSRRRPVSTS